MLSDGAGSRRGLAARPLIRAAGGAGRSLRGAASAAGPPLDAGPCLPEPGPRRQRDTMTELQWPPPAYLQGQALAGPVGPWPGSPDSGPQAVPVLADAALRRAVTDILGRHRGPAR